LQYPQDFSKGRPARLSIGFFQSLVSYKEMPYEVLARKWRPQVFEDVIGQEHITQTLVNAIRTGRLAHAYIFGGPRGVGKTSVARIFCQGHQLYRGRTGNTLQPMPELP